MWRSLTPAVALIALTGCGGTAKLAGKVSYQGRPVLSGYVTVLNEDGTAATGVIQPDGTYTVEGVKRGRARIGVTSPDPARARSILNKTEGKAGHPHGKETHAHTRPGTDGWFPLPQLLADPEKSGLVCDVSGLRVQHDIDAK